ncbi:unnamed protein product [Enterobius vermicularis]|uniref:C-type lectin domain-containing protein n=1 Tax=Enterobius vermicularis TaxID=51028 RepID=A0A0N4V0M2_ENTVE|nr:unnamed protein product [Enterobius vermicularis]
MNYDEAADFCEDHGEETLLRFSPHGFWNGLENPYGVWRWLDGSPMNKSLSSFWEPAQTTKKGKHIKVTKRGDWISVNNETCADSVCIIRAEDEGDRRCANPIAPSNERCYNEPARDGEAFRKTVFGL